MVDNLQKIHIFFSVFIFIDVPRQVMHPLDNTIKQESTAYGTKR